MGISAILLLVFLAIICILLILIVLVQTEDGDGLGGIFGGSSNTVFGPRSGNILTKITTVLAILFFSISVIFAFTFGREDKDSEILETFENRSFTEIEETINNPDMDEVFTIENVEIPSDVEIETPSGVETETVENIKE